MLHAKVVQEDDRTLLPAEAARELGADLVSEEVVEDRGALLLGHPVQPHRMGDVDVQRLAARLRMHADDWVRGFVDLPRVGESEKVCFTVGANGPGPLDLKIKVHLAETYMLLQSFAFTVNIEALKVLASV